MGHLMQRRMPAPVIIDLSEYLSGLWASEAMKLRMYELARGIGKVTRDWGESSPSWHLALETVKRIKVGKALRVSSTKSPYSDSNQNPPSRHFRPNHHCGKLLLLTHTYPQYINWAPGFFTPIPWMKFSPLGRGSSNLHVRQVLQIEKQGTF